MRTSKDITYYASLSVKDNAKKNGCSEDAIRHYIKVHHIDRRADDKIRIITKAKKVLAEHPRYGKKEVSKEIGVALSTIYNYWEYITDEKPFLDFDAQKAKIRNGNPDSPVPVKSNRKELMSEAFKDVSDAIEKSVLADVTEYRKFLLEAPTKPMIFLGAGGCNGYFTSMLYSMGEGVGVSYSPLSFSSISDAAIRNSRCLIISGGGRNIDVVYAAERIMKLNPENCACFTSNPDPKTNKLDALAKQYNARSFVFPTPHSENNFISIRPKFYAYGVHYKAFTGQSDADAIQIDFAPEHCFTYKTNKPGIDLPNLGSIQCFHVLYAGFGEPVAKDIESVFAETGVAAVMLSDYRNYCHGRFIYASNHTKNDIDPETKTDTALVLLITPREKVLAQRILDDAVPFKTPIITITTDYETPLATLDLEIKAYSMMNYIGESHGINLCSPLNKSNVPKRVPISIPFETEITKHGQLEYTKTDKEEYKLKRIVDDFLEREHQITARLQDNPKYLPIPEKSDIWKQQEYDAEEYVIYAFRRKEDKHKSLPVPFGNMNTGFAYKLKGVKVPTSECAYILGLFSLNTPFHRLIQESLLKARSGYDAKRSIRYKNSEFGRADWNEWNVDWMMYCVYCKVRGNKAFRELLMKVPLGAMLIEDTSFQPKHENDTSGFWGARNSSMKEFDKAASKYIIAANPNETKAQINRLQLELTDDFCNYGTYVGCNAMGKILTIVKDCIHRDTVPPIDYDLLSSKNIYILGQRLTFDKEKAEQKEKNGSI